MSSPWFQVQPLEPDTYVISEWDHWEQTHCYLLLGRERALLIDTGLGVAPLRPVVDSLTSLPVTAVLTHAHWDHIGSLGEFDRRLAHPLEAPWLSDSFPLPLSIVKANLLREPCPFPPEFDPEHYAIYQEGVTGVIEDGQTFDLGGRTVTALHTPGHSPGHLCSWEEGRGALYSGDLLYQGKLDLFYPTTDPAAFLPSARRVAALPIQTIRPGHFSLNVSPALARDVLAAAQSLREEGNLRHGAGLFPFHGFSIHL